MKIKWGVIGSGGIAKRRTIPEGIVPAVNAELIAVYDLDTAINGLIAEQYGAKAVTSVDELLREDIDAVYIASRLTVIWNMLLRPPPLKNMFSVKNP